MFQYHRQNILTIRDVNLKNKTVLVRVDFNISRDSKTGEIIDDFRIKAALPTIKFLLKSHNKIILASHLGRPEGRKDLKYTLAPVAAKLAELLKQEVKFADDCAGDEVEKIIQAADYGEIILLENLRFYPGEEKNDPRFAKELAALAEVYVNDAFAVCHRANASVEAITEFMPHCAGLLLEREVIELSRVKDAPEAPLVAIIGGLKIKDKIGVIENIAAKADKILIGGAVANTFLAARKIKIGRSVYEPEKINLAERLLNKFSDKLVLPSDGVVAAAGDSLTGENIDIKNVSAEQMILDIGDNTMAEFDKIIRQAKTIFWAGPMGYYENDEFIVGTQKIAESVISSRGKSIIGGGDTVTVINKLGLFDRFSHVSTGGGASLEILSDLPMPALEALTK